MRKDKILAIRLRRQKKSYNEIAEKFNIPKSTLVYWFKNLKWSKKIKNELLLKDRIRAAKQIASMNKARKEKWESWREGFRQEAKEQFAFIKNNSLFIAGINLYWGEGDSVLKNGIVRLANTDYRMISLFYKFLINICGIPKDKIKASLVIYPDLNDIVCKNFWSKNTEIAHSSFHKSQLIKGRHPTKRLQNGVCSIQVYSRGLKEKIMVWIDLFSKNL